MSYNLLPNCLKCSILAGGLLLLQATQAQSDFSDLEQLLTARQKQLGKDYVLQVWKQGDTLAYQKKAGELTPKTSVDISSSSKWLTTALVLLFVEEGKISLDDKITRWLPEYEKYGKNYITIRHCLSNMTGIKTDGRLFQKKKYASLEEEVNAYAAREIQTNPGTEFRYSHIGYNIAGRVLEIVTKKKFDQLAKQRLFAPLKMRNTSFSNLTGGAVSPADGASSTADDYMKFLVMLMNRGTYHGRRVLGEESVNELLKAQPAPGALKEVPRQAEAFTPALGSWIMNKNITGSSQSDGSNTANASAITYTFSSPGFNGIWPVVDLCRGYAYLFVIKDGPDDKGTLQAELKATVDGHFKGDCPE